MKPLAGTAAGLGRRATVGPLRCCRVVDGFPLAQFAIELSDFQPTSGDLVELLGAAFGAFDGAVSWGERGGSTNRCRVLWC